MPQKIPVALKRALFDILGAQGLILEGQDLIYYGADRCRGDWQPRAGAIARPSCLGELEAVICACALYEYPMVPSGGRTGLAGAATAIAGEVVVSLSRMARILSVDPSSRLLCCEAGATVQAVQEAAATHGLIYPIDFAAKGSAQIGGTVATNAGGVKVIRYGSTRAWVQGMKVILADGERLDLGGALEKDNTGIDLRQLFVGSEGTLGVIAELTLRLCPPPAAQKVALCRLDRELAVLELFSRLRASGLTLSAFECFDRASLERVLAHRTVRTGPFEESGTQHVLVEVICEDVSGAEAMEDRLMNELADAQEAGEISDALLAAGSKQEAALWAWREDISESLHGHSPHKADVSVPVAKIGSFIERWRREVAQWIPEVPSVIFGHVGDGNLHLNLLRPQEITPEEFLRKMRDFDEITYALVGSYSGSISAEHGIGLLKREHLHYSRSPREIDAMRSIKRALDPHGIMNPGKVL